MTGMPSLLARLDQFQRRRRVLAFAWATVKKYLDDDGARHAALITYYGFLSMFPLLLIGVAVVTEVLSSNPGLRQRLITEIVPPVLQDTVTDAAAALPTSPVAFVVGAAGLFYAATGVVYASYRTVNHVAAVPMRDLPSPVGAYARVFGALLLLLVGVIAAGGLAVIGAILPFAEQLPAVLGTALAGFAVLTVGARLLLCRPAPLRALWPAATIGALVLTVILHLGAPLLARLVRNAGPVYGAFATVAGLFALLYLVSQALVLAAEIAAVRYTRLWPRALDSADPTAADERALALLAREQERIPGQVVESRIIHRA